MGVTVKKVDLRVGSARMALATPKSWSQLDEIGSPVLIQKNCAQEFK
jgi:hypothetical protein